MAARALQIRSLGLSNYAVEDFTELMQSASVTPAINQIEINPFLYRKQTIEVPSSRPTIRPTSNRSPGSLSPCCHGAPRPPHPSMARSSLPTDADP